MKDAQRRSQDSLLQEVAILLSAITSNLDLLSLLVKDLLQGENNELQEEELTFARKVDEVLYHATLTALELLHVLGVQTEVMMPQARSKLTKANVEYDQLTTRWRSLMESVHEIYKLRTPCQ